MNRLFKILPYVLAFVFGLLLFKQCKKEDKVVTKTEYIKVTDTITRVKIQEKPIIRYVHRTKTVKGNDSIIYLSKKDSTSIQANEYKTKLESNNATADLSILTTGELLDVSGVIHYTQKETTVERFKNASGLFLYGQGSIGNKEMQEIGVGFDYVIKNKYIAGIGVNYNNLVKAPYLNFKIGINLFN